MQQDSSHILLYTIQNHQNKITNTTTTRMSGEGLILIISPLLFHQATEGPLAHIQFH